jgi:hypothetical protein
MKDQDHSDKNLFIFHSHVRFEANTPGFISAVAGRLCRPATAEAAILHI